jgi:diguanylate cyclase (GGDEF)-like protein
MQHQKNNNLILIIDDNVQELKDLGALLHGLGDVIFATSVETGLQIVEQRKPDLVICSANFPTLGCGEICRQIKSKRETHDTSIMVISRTSAAELEALEAGAVDFIAQPFSPPILLARVKTHLSFSHHKSVLQNLADKDGLTDVFNRRYFDNQARIELKRHYRQQQALTLALLDIDHFKIYNDAYGHLQGDICIREVAQAIDAASRRPGEFVARYGGEEFVAVLPNTNPQNAKKYGRWICAQVLSLAIPHGYSTTAPFITISCGIATVVPQANMTLENLIATADTALYQAKSSGRNQFKVATLVQETIQEVG